MKSLDVLAKQRKLIDRAFEGLSSEQLLAVPKGFTNNILWNFGHIVVTQEMLTYRLSGLDLHLPEAMAHAFGRGSSPESWTDPPDAEQVRRELRDSPARLAADYAAGRFSGFQGYTTSTGLELRDVEEAIAFNNFHEGIHLGVILAQRKLV